MKHIKIFEENELPSHFQIKDLVMLDFLESGKLVNCRISNVHFSESDVSYDVEIMFAKGAVTEIKGVDAEFVKKPKS